MVVSEPRPGYGAAVHAGLLASTAEFVAVIDGDGSMDPAQLVPMLAEVTSGRADLAVGRRRPTARGVWPWHARAGNALVLWWLRRRLGMPLHDIAPMRVARREELLGLGVEDRRFGYPVELLQRATTAGWRFAELRHRLPPEGGGHPVQGVGLGARHPAYGSGLRPGAFVRPAVALVVAKSPVAGRVKTRLGREVGMERAAELAAAALLDTRRGLRRGVRRRQVPPRPRRRSRRGHARRRAARRHRRLGRASPEGGGAGRAAGARAHRRCRVLRCRRGAGGHGHAAASRRRSPPGSGPPAGWSGPSSPGSGARRRLVAAGGDRAAPAQSPARGADVHAGDR